MKRYVAVGPRVARSSMIAAATASARACSTNSLRVLEHRVQHIDAELSADHGGRSQNLVCRGLNRDRRLPMTSRSPSGRLVSNGK